MKRVKQHLLSEGEKDENVIARLFRRYFDCEWESGGDKEAIVIVVAIGLSRLGLQKQSRCLIIEGSVQTDVILFTGTRIWIAIWLKAILPALTAFPRYPQNVGQIE